MEITHKQRKDQGAVFTTCAAPLIEAEQISGYTKDPKIIYWEDSVGGGDLAIAIAHAKFDDQRDVISDDKNRITDIFKNQIFMNDIDTTFLEGLLSRLESFVQELTNDCSFACTFNIEQADTVHPNFNPCEFWGFASYRTITNRSYTEIEQLPDPSTRKMFQQFYQSKIFPDNASTGKKFKLTDCGQYKAISDDSWLGGVDLRPHMVPKSLQTDDIQLIDYRNSVRDMFIKHHGKQGAGQKVVVLQYDREAHGLHVVQFGDNKTRSFSKATEAWEFYQTLCTHNFTTTDSQRVLTHIVSSCPNTISTFCKVQTGGSTLGNKKKLLGNENWMQSLIQSENLEPGAFVKWVNPKNIIIGGVDTNMFALLPYTYHPQALAYYLKQVPPASTHAVPAEKKGLPQWQAATGMILYHRHNPQFTKDKNGLAVGISNGFAGAGQTGSVILVTSRSGIELMGRRVANDYQKIILAVCNSSYGHFMQAKCAKQHNEAKSMVQLGAGLGKIPLFDLDVNEADSLLTLADEMMDTNTIDLDQLDQAVYKCMPFISSGDKQVIADYIINRS